MSDIKLLGNKNGANTVIFKGGGSSFSRVKSVSVQYTVSGGSRTEYDDGPQPSSTFSGSVSKIFKPTCECDQNVFNGGTFTQSGTAYGEFQTGRDDDGLPTYEWRPATRTRVWVPRLSCSVQDGSLSIYVSTATYGENLVSDTGWQPSENLATGRYRIPAFLSTSEQDSEPCVYTQKNGTIINDLTSEFRFFGTAKTYGTETLIWNVNIA
jgi:hypothetical protein